jgi:predicted phosphate transport protein (TIGR00153 family)
MYEKSLLPETREDLLMIIETIDKIPNEAEAIANDFVIQKTILFPEIKSPFMELINLSVDSVEKTLDATRDCFGKRKKIAEFNLLIDNNESLGDSLEREMISKVFETELPSGDKLIQKDLIIKLGNICDLCENVLDKIVICSVKRQI